MKKYMFYMVFWIGLILMGQKGMYGEDLLSGAGLSTSALKITSEEGYKSPRWSPLGDRILLHRVPQKGIWIVQPDGKELKQVVAHGWLEQWSLDGTKILFGDVEDYHLKEVDLLGNIQGVRNVSLTDLTVRVILSPDGTKIAVLETNPDPSPGKNDLLLRIISSDGTKSWNGGWIETHALHLYWSPDSQKIAYFKIKPILGTTKEVPKPTIGDLWVFDISTGTHTQVTRFGDLDVGPKSSSQIWSSDGNTLIFSRKKTEGGAIWQINLDGTSAKEILSERMSVNSVSFSPDRTKMLYKTPLGLYVTTPQGGQSNTIALGKITDYSCSPDSGKVACELDGDIWTIGIP